LANPVARNFSGELKVRGERKGKRCHTREKDANREAEALDDIMVIRNRGIALYAPILPREGESAGEGRKRESLGKYICSSRKMYRDLIRLEGTQESTRGA
jgi:hypothetical protein